MHVFLEPMIKKKRKTQQRIPSIEMDEEDAGIESEILSKTDNQNDRQRTNRES